MKKVLAVFLSLLCVASMFTIAASAGSFDEISSMLESGNGDSTLYGISYQNETLSNVSMMYKPNPSLSFDGPGYVTVTKDTPLAVDHDFVCWKDKDGKLYYEGDKVYVDGQVTLYAVWEEKKDNDPHILRVIKTALKTFERMLLTFLGVIKDVQDFDSSYQESKENELTASSEPVTVPSSVPASE